VFTLRRRSSSRVQGLAVIAIVVASLAAASCGDSGSSAADSSAPESPTSATGEGADTTETSDTSSAEATLDLSSVSVTYGYSTTRGKSRHAHQLASGAFDGLPFSLQWAEFTNSEDAMAAMLANRIDMQEAQPSALATVVGSAETPWTAETAPMRVIGALRYTTPEGVQIVVPDDSPIRSVADLRGKKVVFSRGSQSQYFLFLALQQAGVKSSDITQVKMKLSEARAAFASGDVDAIVAFDFNLIPLFREQKLRVIARSADTNVPLYSLIVVRADRLADEAWVEAYRIMLGAVGRVEEWVAANVDEARKLREDLDGVDPLDSEAGVRFGLSTLVPVSDELIAAVQAQADLFHAEGVIENLPDMSVVFDRRYGSGT